MKKLFCLLGILATVCAFTACGKSASASDTAEKVQPSFASSAAAGQQASSQVFSPTETQQPDAVSAEPVIDEDLTQLSSTMVYSEVYNMMNVPQDYAGKVIRIQGLFSIGYSYLPDGSMDESTMRYACVVTDAAACCAQGIEFVLAGAYSYPDDYPPLDSEITVTGTFESYEENGLLACRLVNAVLSA